MKFKKLIILIMVLAVLVTIAVTKKTHENGDSLKKPAPATPLLSEGLSTAFVQKIVISKGGDSGSKIVLSKSDVKEWTLESRSNTKVQSGPVEMLIKNVSDLKGDVRAESKEVVSDFFLLESQAIQIQFLAVDDKMISSVLVSPLRAGGELNFVRLTDSDRVMAASPDILSSLGIYAKSDPLDDKIFPTLEPKPAKT